MKNNINGEVLETKLLRLGFRENIMGTLFVREAIKLWQPMTSITAEIYPAVAEKYGSTPGRVERAIRHAIETAWERAEYNTMIDCFGYTIDPERGKPSNSEFISRMARVCSNAD